jgi:hypothetical protein
MNWSDRLELSLALALAAMPFGVNLYLLIQRRRFLEVKPWRLWIATAGLVLALIASFPTPVFYFALELPWGMKGNWLVGAAPAALYTGLAAGMAAMVLLWFARGRVRWLGLGTTIVSVVLLYVSTLGLSPEN